LKKEPEVLIPIKQPLFIPPKSCPKSWKFYGDHCYQFRQDRVTWDTAYAECSAQNAQLLDIKSREEQNFLYRRTGYKLWLAMTDNSTKDPSHDGKFIWTTDGRSVDAGFTNFLGYQPANTLNDADCGYMNDGWTNIGGGWATTRCSDKNHFVCKAPVGQART